MKDTGIVHGLKIQFDEDSQAYFISDSLGLLCDRNSFPIVYRKLDEAKTFCSTYPDISVGDIVVTSHNSVLSTGILFAVRKISIDYIGNWRCFAGGIWHRAYDVIKIIKAEDGIALPTLKSRK